MNNQVAIFDVDDTLLDYSNSLYDWIRGNSLIKFWKFDKIDYGEMSDIFNETFHMRNLKPLKNAVKSVKSFHDNGFDLKIVSSFSNKYQAYQMRVENLENIFGEVFSDYSFSDWGGGQENKRRIIQSQLDQNKEVYYFDDDFEIFYNFSRVFENEINDGNLHLYRIDVGNDWLDIMKDLKWD